MNKPANSSVKFMDTIVKYVNAGIVGYNIQSIPDKMGQKIQTTYSLSQFDLQRSASGKVSQDVDVTR